MSTLRYATMIIRNVNFLVLLITVGLATSHITEDRLGSIEEEFWEWRLKISPEFASSVGVTLYNDVLASYNMSVFDNRRAAVQSFQHRLDNIDMTDLPLDRQTDYRVLWDHLQTYLDGYTWRFYESLNPMSFLEGLQTNPTHFTEVLPFHTSHDFHNYLTRLQHLPRQLSEFRSLFTEAVRRGHTLHRVSIEAVPGQIDKLLVDDVTTSPFFAPFKGKLDKLRLSEEDREEIRRVAELRVKDVLDAFKTLKEFIQNDYLPHTRASWGIGGWDGGRDNYRACLRWHLTLDLSPEHVHRLGLREVARIKAKMEQTMQRMNFTGSISDFFNMIRREPKFHMKSGDKLLQRYKDIIYDDIFPRLHEFFNDIPELPLRVSPMPFDGVGGEYLAGRVDGTRPGVFYVNLFHPSDIATIDMKSLSLHETVPGHHFQAIYTLAADLPPYRKFHEDTNFWQAPFKFPFYTSYLEGWALYAEHLGEEMHIYKDDYELMGRYGSEMFRACRLVIDTGIHYFNWDEDRAVEFMLAHTAYSRNDILSEVHRYVTWPGQACAYKVGEITIKQLRARAANELGPLFDIKEFHSVLLKNGPVPLSVLETQVDIWIQSQLSMLYAE